jgi:PAS domain S-box-containing protein
MLPLATHTTSDPFRLLVESLCDDALFLLSPEGRIDTWNPGAENLIGFTRHEAVGRSHSDLYQPRDVAAGKCEQDLRAALEHGRHEDQARLIRPDGSIVWVARTITALRDGDRHAGFSVRLREVNGRQRPEGPAQPPEKSHENEAVFRSAFEDTNVAMVLTTLDHRFVRVNAAFARLFGYTRTEMLGMTMPDITHPDDLAESLARRRPLLAGESHFLQQKRYLHRDGHVIWGLTNVSLVRDASGRPLLYVGQVQDITDRKRAEDALRREREFVRLVLDTDPNLIFVKDADGRFVLANKALADLYGTTPQALVGRSVGDDLPSPRESPEYRRIEQEVLRTGRAVEVDETNTRPDGRVYWFRTIKVPLALPDGTTHVLGIATDITERKRAEEALRQTQQRLEHVISSSPAVLYTLAIEGDQLRDIAWMSENVRGMLGYTPEETTSAGWWTGNIHANDRERVVANIRQELFAGGRATNEYRFRHKDGRYRWVRSEMLLLRDGGRAVEAVGSWSDITERKQMEEQFRQAQKMEVAGRLAGGVAHDFNNLLTVINGYGQILLDQLPKSDPTRELIQDMVSAGERAAALTSQLLAFSRKALVEPKVLDLNEVVAQSAKLLRRLIGEDIVLATALAPRLSPIKADPSQVEQIVMNLAVNARDAMPRGGRLTIETRDVRLGAEDAANYSDLRPGRYVQLAVSDTGVGMTDEVKSRVFEPFFTTKEAGKGTGLGLAMVYGAVKAHGGHIGVYSELGVGTTFKILLPTTQESAGPRSGEVRIAPRGAETVLLVEDDASVRRLARLALETQGYAILEADCGADAVRMANAHAGPIEILVTDVVMPAMGGREVAEALRSKRSSLKVLYISGYTDDAVVRHGVIEAMDAFLQKPFTPLALARKVRAVLDGS